MGLCVSKAGLVEVEARQKVPRNNVPVVDSSQSEQKLHDAPSDAAIAAQLTVSLLQDAGNAALPAKAAAVPAGPALPSCGGVPLGCPFPPELCCPWNEDARQKSLQELGVIGQLPEPRFDTIVELMKSIFQVQVASVSLVDWEEISFHARAGEWACRAGRAGSFCDWIFIPPNPTMLIVEDATKDVRFQQNKYVEGPSGIRFYAGAPLVASDSGHRYGTLCVIDYKPRHFAAEQYSILAHFAEIVTRELERSKVLRWQQHVLQAATLQHMTMLRAMDCFSEGIMLCDPSQPGWPILYCNDAWVATTGVSRDLALSAGGFWRLFAAKQIDGALLSAAEAGATAGEAAAAAATEGAVAGAAAEATAGAAAAAAPWAAAVAGTARDAVLASAAAQKRSFRAQVTPRDAAAASGAAPALLFEFKPSGTGEHLREDMPHIGIPGFVGFGSGSGGPIATGSSSGGGGSRSAPGSNSALATGGSVIGTNGSAVATGGSAIATGGGSIASGGSRASGSGGSVVPPGSPPAARESGHSYYFGIVKGRDLAVLLPGSQPSSATVADGSLSSGSALQTTISSDGVLPETPAAAAAAAAAVGSGHQKAVLGCEQPSLEGSKAAAAAPRLPAGAVAQASADGQELSLLQQQQREREQVVAAGLASLQTHLPPVPSFQQMRPKVMEEVVLGPLLGCGSNGRCYRGVWHGGHVAVKILDCWVNAPEGGAAEGAAGPAGELQTEPVLEAILSKSLSHPHIVTTFDYAISTQEPCEGSSRGKVHQQVWIIQGYCNRGSLFHAVESGMLRGSDGQPSLLAILQTASEIAGALCYIHGRDILHGDLTPNNILLTSSNKDARRFTTQVADFGLARVASGSGGVTTETIGTVTHMPPEMLLGGSLSQATDVYSFGVILWEMWEGRRAWKGLSAPQIMHAVGSGSLTLAPQETAPDWLQDLMRRCLSRDPAQRPSFEEMLELLLAKVKAMRQAQKQDDSRRRERRRSLESKRSMEPKRSQELKKGMDSKKSMELPPGLLSEV